MAQPSLAGVVWPVRQRHQSMAKARAMAVMICLRRGRGHRGSSSRDFHFLISQ